MTRGAASIPYATLAALACLATLATLATSACKTTSPTDEGKTAMPYTSDSWCPDGFEVGPADTCFLVPEHPAKDTPVLVYLHGLFQRKGSQQEWETVKVAAQRGFAVVLPRGKRRLCAWRTDVKDQYCWPQDPDDTPTIKALVAEWDRVLWQVDAVLEGGTHKRYLFGNGDGASFAVVLATRGLFPAQAVASFGGGVLGQAGQAGVAGQANKAKVPLLLAASQDDTDHAAKTKELHDTLAKTSWPHAYCPRSGAAPMSVDDVDQALRFLKRDADGTLKREKEKDGPGYACDARR